MACFVILSVVMATFAIVGCTVEELGTSNNDFGFDIYRKLIEAEDVKNIIFSPVSINSALAMTRAGAMGDTKSQMTKALNLDELQDVDESYKELAMILNAGNANYTLRNVNRLFGRKGYQFLQTFLDLVDQNYGGGLESLDFVNDPTTARLHINDWVASQTEDKIKDLLPDGSITTQTALVLVNAIYFKGLWALPFEAADTQPAQFNVDSNTVETVDMMFLDKKFNYGESDALGCKILEMPYTDEGVSFYVLLPNAIDGLKNLEAKLTAESLNTEISKMSNSAVLVYIPKFKITQEANLRKLLISLGLTDMFDPKKADFSAIAGSKDLVVTEVVHKAYIEVNEEGTEAAAATGVIIGVTAIFEKPEFKADHPFIFLIRDKKSGTILFLGRIVKPTSGESGEPVIGEFGEGGEYEVDDGDKTSGATCWLVHPLAMSLLLACALFCYRLD